MCRVLHTLGSTIEMAMRCCFNCHVALEFCALDSWRNPSEFRLHARRFAVVFLARMRDDESSSPAAEIQVPIKAIEPMSVVHQIRCDRCGKEAERGEIDFTRMRSLGFDAGYDSVFGDGNRVELDLCEPCFRDALGAWLRVRTPADTPLANMLKAFKPEIHEGEFPLIKKWGLQWTADWIRAGFGQLSAAAGQSRPRPSLFF